MVTLRFKKIKNDKYSVYLDIYVNGRRDYKFLNIHVTQDYSKPLTNKKGQPVLDKNNIPKRKPIAYGDEQKILLAEDVKRKVELEISQSEHGFTKKKFVDHSFTKYMNKYITDNDDDGTRRLKYNIDNFLQKHHKDKKELYFSDITFTWIEDFKRFLEVKLGQNSVRTYLYKLKQILLHAKRAGIISEHNFNDIEIPQKFVPDIDPLTVDDIQVLVKTPLKHNPQIKQAFLFSCYTGLRQSDVLNLKWENIDFKTGRMRLMPLKTSNRRHHKTNVQGKILDVPLSESALKILLEVKKVDWTDKVFSQLPKRQVIGKHLRLWGLYAGLKKHIHFHLARHSFATIGITHGIGLYDMQSFLLHSKPTQSMRYAKIVDDRKKSEIAKFPVIE